MRYLDVYMGKGDKVIDRIFTFSMGYSLYKYSYYYINKYKSIYL